MQAVVAIHFYWQELHTHFFCKQMLLYKVFIGKSYLLIFFCWKLLLYKIIIGKSYLFIFFVSCCYTVFTSKSYLLIFFLLAVVVIQCLQARVIFTSFSVGNSCYTKLLLARVIFSHLMLAVVSIHFYWQELSSHIFTKLLLVIVIFSFFSVGSCIHVIHLGSQIGSLSSKIHVGRMIKQRRKFLRLGREI